MQKGNFGAATLAVAIGLSGRNGLKVVFGSGPRTDGKVVYLPGDPNSQDPRYLTLVKGFLDHETAHIMFTDFNGYKKAKLRYPEKVVHTLTNAIEDVRIEYRMGEAWPGCKLALKECAQLLADEGRVRNASNLIEALGLWLSLKLECECLGRRFFDPYRRKARDMILASGVLLDDHLQKMETLVDSRFDPISMDTGDVIELVQDILDIASM